MKSTVLLLNVAVLLAAAGANAGSIDMHGVGGGEYSIPITSLKESKFQATLKQQYDFSCGSAAVATLLTHHYGYPITEQAVFEEMFARGDQQKIRQEGFSLLDMKRFLEEKGFQADGFEKTLDELKTAKLPAIVLIKENGYYHFVVIKGIQDGRILIGDPSQGTRAVARSSFEAIWVNRLLFVIHNRQELAKFNGAADWRVTPRAPIGTGVNQDGLGNLTLPKFGPGDF